MSFDQAVTFFLPRHIQENKTHARYHELRVIISSSLLALPLLLLFPLFLYCMHKPVTGYFINGALIITTLISIKLFGHYRIPMSITALGTYIIIYDWIKESGYIYSSNVSILHMYLLAAIWVDKKYGWWAVFGNIAVFYFIYHQTLQTGIAPQVHSLLGGPLYAFGMNVLITIFFGGFMAYQQYDQEKDRSKIRGLQDQKITMLDEAVKQRTEQLNSMRETIATDFHDETGNMLSAITRQASLLKIKLDNNSEVQPVVESIILNSNALYASSKDFLWHLNHNSDDPQELFSYLTAYGQRYYNQFDIAFSSTAHQCHLQQLEPMAALNLLFIFKEAMTNVVKHANATEVKLTMRCAAEQVTYKLEDNGTWKDADYSGDHYGLTNMERRCEKSKFGFGLIKQSSGTRIEIKVPVHRLNAI